jgi:putative transposase
MGCINQRQVRNGERVCVPRVIERASRLNDQASVIDPQTKHPFPRLKINATRSRVLLHMMMGSKEDAETVTAFFEDMKRRGLNDPLLVTSDGAPGIIKAIEICFPRAARQRCLAHRMRNLAAKVPEDVWPEFKARVQAAYQAPSRAIARELAAGIVADYGRKYDSAVACFMDDFEACIAHLRFPVTHRRAIRTTNLLERLFVEERRRLKIIPNAFGERAVLKLMFGALIRAAERWRSVKVTEFERRQMAAVRKELDEEYEAAVGLNKQPSKDGAQPKISSNSQSLSENISEDYKVFGA